MDRHEDRTLTRSRAPLGRVPALLLAAPFLLAACATAAGETEAPAATAGTASTTTGAPTQTATVPSQAATASEAPADEAGTWLDIQLTDAQTGETFTLASLGGGVVALEPMAIWCTNCKAQQDNVKQAYGQVEASGVTYISLGIDPGESAQALAAYAERRGYPWTFVQSPRELSRALVDAFGPQILSAPSTPLIVLDANGEVAAQEFGFHGPDALLDILGEAAA